MDALNSAEDVYKRYLTVGQAVSESGGQGVEDFQPFLTATALAQERQGAQVLIDRKLVSTGATKLTAFKLQQADLKTGRVAAYACVDLSGVRVKTASGKDVTPTSRPNKQTLRPTFVWQSGHLLMEGNGTWTGSSVC